MLPSSFPAEYMSLLASCQCLLSSCVSITALLCNAPVCCPCLHASPLAKHHNPWDIADQQRDGDQPAVLPATEPLWSSHRCWDACTASCKLAFCSLSDRVCTAAPWIVSGSHTTANFSGVAWIWWCTQGAKIASRWLFRNTLGTQREAVSVT